MELTSVEDRVKGKHVHLIGVGGTGMTALAGLLHQAGCRVTGSDRALYPPTSEILASMNLEVATGFGPQNLQPKPDLVVVGNAISRGNPELEEVLLRGMEFTSMPRLLNEHFLKNRHSIVVMGTHGKTTTTSMIAWVLHAAGHRPGYLIGGLPQDLPQPFELGEGKAFVIEGDEYDSAFDDKGPKFMHYRPQTAILGTVEFDHADIYRDLEHVKQVFRRVAHLVPPQGLLIRHEESPVCCEVTETVFSRRVGFGLNHGDWCASEFTETEAGSQFEVMHDGAPVAHVKLALGGEHNALNALATMAACAEQGVDPSAAAAALSRFKGVRRRLEISGVADGVTVIDDFAHHPTAIQGTLRSLHRRFPGRKLWAVLEPRSWSLRRNVFQDRLPEALAPADEVFLAEVFQSDQLPENERLDPERLVTDLQRMGTPARFLADAESIAKELAKRTKPGDIVTVMSNGGFDGMNGRLLERLRAREVERQSVPGHVS